VRLVDLLRLTGAIAAAPTWSRSLLSGALAAPERLAHWTPTNLETVRDLLSAFEDEAQWVDEEVALEARAFRERVEMAMRAGGKE
jgi:hypothetical protein